MKRYNSYKPSNIAWLGEIPSHWKTIRIKYLFSEIEDRNENLKFPLLSFSRKRGIVPFSEINEKQPSAADLSKYKIIRSGQLLENRMQAWSGMFAKSEIEGCVSPDYSVFSANNADICVDYYAHLFRTNNYIAHWSNLSRGIGDGFNRLYTNQFHSVVAIFPPLDEQKKIVEFLSEKIALIDEQQADIAKEIELLQELKQDEIANAVTHGLNPDVKMKESGIPWVGKIPEHWQEQRLSNIFYIASITNCVGVPLLSVFLGKGVVPFNAETSRRTNAISENTNLSKYQLVEPGDFVLNNQQAWRGSVGVSFFKGIISPAYIVLKLKLNLNLDFADYALQSNHMVGQYLIYSKGVGSIQRNLSWNDLKNSILPIPPVDEQKAIVEYIKQKTSAIDEMIAKLKFQSEFLTEYKQRLIADVVTGQVKVD